MSVAAGINDPDLIAMAAVHIIKLTGSFRSP
jgi:hypothetical protein